jgi:hypothetical protein
MFSENCVEQLLGYSGEGNSLTFTESFHNFRILFGIEKKALVDVVLLFPRVSRR